MDTLQAIELLGPPTCLTGDARLPLLPERAHQLVSFLAASGGWQSRERLAALFWPDLASAAARRNLRHLLFKAAPHWPSLETRDASVRLEIACDSRAFEAAHDTGDDARALELYRGGFAEGLEANAPEPFADWLRFERHRLAAMHRASAARCIAALDAGAARERVARQWLKIDPLDEDALLAVADALVAGGRGGEARRLASEFAQRLAAQLGVEPSARVRALVAAASGSTAKAAAAIAPAPLPPATAPVPAVAAAAAQGFVGRRAELRELADLLARDECRVLTVTGPGGIGKSRLVQVALAALAPRHDRAAWVSLEDLSDVAQVAPRIAAAFGFALAGRGDPLAQVIERLRPGRALIAADNSEHLAGFAELCATLLAACPALKMLHTSRGRLAIDGEWLLPLQGLPAPDADETDLGLLRNFDAVRLFEARARAVLPSFDAERQAVDMAALARDVEGAPLAIELAAAWARLLPVAEIRREIAGSLELLEGAAGAARQRSVVASFEYSWTLLAPIEQATLARLSVFAGAFSREAAALVADAGLPLLAALLDKSLLRAHGNGRLSLHALTRQCARAKLADASAVQRRHMEYFARALASRDGPRSSRREVLDAIEGELEDARLAWQHALAIGDPAALERMAVPLARFLEVKGRLAEGVELLCGAADAVEASEASGDGQALARQLAIAALQRGIGSLRYRQGDLGAADAALARAAAIYRERELPALLRPCVLLLGVAAWARGDAAAAEAHFEDVRRLAEPGADDDDLAARAANGLALCARSRGDYLRAVGLHEESVRLHRRAGSAAGEASALHDLGVAELYRRRPADAERALAQALAVCDGNGLAHIRIYCLVSLAFARIDLGRLDAAQIDLDAAAEADRASGSSLVSPMVRLASARVAVRRGDAGAAKPLLAESLTLFGGLASVPMLLAALVFVGEWLAASGQRARAAALWSAVAADKRAEHNDRDDARTFLAALGCSDAEREAAAREAAGFDLGKTTASLLETLGGAGEMSRP